jgi:iron complex transport system permease protein
MMMKKTQRYIIYWVIGFILLWIVTFLICSGTGAISISIAQVKALWVSKIMGYSATAISGLDKASIIYWQIRVPRLILATFTGIALATTGAAFQSIFRNPMADPYVLGISSGASLGAAIAIVMGFDTNYLGISGFAFLFAIMALLLVFFIASRSGHMRSQVLLLAGIAVSFMSSAIVSLLLVLNREKIERILFWTLGGLNSASWQQLYGIIPLVIVGTFIIYYFSRHLNLMSMGNETAHSLGVNTQRTSLILLITSSLMVSVIVANTGVIGFAGLIIPHIIRLITGPDNRLVIPLSVVAGAIFLMVSDTLARVIIPPSELPVGSITALFGVPYFLFLLYQSQKKL